MKRFWRKKRYESGFSEKTTCSRVLGVFRFSVPACYGLPVVRKTSQTGHQTPPKGNILEITLRRDYSEVDRMVHEVSLFLAGKQWPGQWYPVHLVLRELVINALKHGGSEEKDTTVSLKLSIEASDNLRIVVSDNGSGWNWREHDWTPPTPVSANGRGLFLVSRYASSVRFNSRGNRISVEMEPDSGD